MIEEYIKNNCPLEVPGLLSLAIERAYKKLDELIKTTPLLQKPEARKCYGYLRNALIDIAIDSLFKDANANYSTETKPVNEKKNAYTYKLIKVPGACITPVKSQSKGSFPRKAIYRDKGSLLNYELSLFDNPQDCDHSQDPFMLLTYGGANYKLNYVMLGIPNFEDNKWISVMSIKGKPVPISNSEKKHLEDKLNLSLTKKAAEIRRNNDGTIGEENV